MPEARNDENGLMDGLRGDSNKATVIYNGKQIA
jgi:hypothetical protein